MDTLSHFHSLDELIRALDRERKLLSGLFQDRKRLSFRYDVARDMAAKKDESLKFLRRFGVIRENGDFVELEDVYMKFFEEVLEVNEEINVASVKESIGNLNAAIDYYQSENSPTRKYGYLKDVKRILRNIALTTLRNVIDLKRNIDNTYKNEPTFAVKKKKLVNLDEKRKDIAVLINECERVIDEKQATFFMMAMDVGLKETVTDVKLQLRKSEPTVRKSAEAEVSARPDAARNQHRPKGEDGRKESGMDGASPKIYAEGVAVNATYHRPRAEDSARRCQRKTQQPLA